MRLRSYRSLFTSLVAGAVLGALALPGLSSAQSYTDPYSNGFAFTSPTYGGGATTLYPDGTSAYTSPSYGGGYTTSYSNGSQAYVSPAYGGGYTTYTTPPVYPPSGYSYP